MTKSTKCKYFGNADGMVGACVDCSENNVELFKKCIKENHKNLPKKNIKKKDINLTREQILNMPAGREMDTLVAKKVFGWDVHSEILGGLEVYYTVHHEPLKDCPEELRAVTGQIIIKRVPDFSTDIAAAWEVVEKLGNMGYTINIQWKGKGRVYENTAEVSITSNIYTVGHGIGTAPIAICKAALMVNLLFN